MRRDFVHPATKGVELPLQAVLSNLPLELQPCLRQADAGDLTISVPLEKILAQLSRGAVKIPFGELRQAVPEIFTAQTDRDRILVPLPLGEILSRLNPALITRRRVQRQVEVPAEISSPFDAGGQGLVFSVGPTKPENEPAAAAPPPRRAAPPPAPSAPGRQTLTSAPTPAAPSAIPLAASRRQPIPRAATPAPPAITPPAAPPTPAPTLPPHPARFGLTQSPSPQFPPAVPALNPIAPAPALTPLTSALHVPRDRNGGFSTPSATEHISHAAPSSGNVEPLVVALTALAEGWPDAVRKEIVSLNLVDAKVALPVHLIEQALRQARIAFSWKTLRSWIRPAVLPAVSAHDGLVLELPLKIVAPLFLARQREAAKPQQKVAIDEDIPNLFFGFPQPEPVQTAVPSSQPAPAETVDSNFYVWDDSTEMVRVDESEFKRGPGPGTRFVAKYATPNEVVSRASALDGVAGALIALPDGLMVANRLPADVNGDTLAAFLPQIFGKLSQSTKELRMGELNNLNFTVGNVPWKIFRVNAIFFAAFGRMGHPLPTSQLAALAAELDHKPK